MREIKFRAWDKHDKKNRKNQPSMLKVTGIFTYSNHDELDIGFVGGRGLFKPDDVVLMQYTGFKDIDGVEIYEGDIVSFDDSTNTEGGWHEVHCIGEVEWDKQTASFQVTERQCAESYEVLSECKVLGNIYENQEIYDMEW